MIDDIISDVLEAEGGDTYTNDPADRGGPTKWGITLKSWQEWRGNDTTADDVKAITEAQARDFYEGKYIVGPKFHLLSDMLTPMVVDCAVNHGQKRAAKWLQEAVGATVDGSIGPQTIAASQATPVLQTYLQVCAMRIRFYGAIVGNDPTQARCIKGWNNRAAKWIDRLALQLE